MQDAVDQRRDDPAHGFIDVLIRVARDFAGRDASVAEIVDRLDERAFALLILILTLPCLVPGLPGAQIIAIPIFLLAGQLALNRSEPWLPGWFLRARVKSAWIEGVAGFADKRLRWTERLARPRLRALAHGPAERLLGLVLALAAITIMLPITNTIPSLAITLAAVGLLQRDGVFVALGSALALAWIAALAAIVGGLAFGAGYALDFVRDQAPWLADWLGPGAAN